MKASLTEQIYLKCPIIFRGRDDGPKRNLMCFGFDCDGGWFNIIESLSLEIEKIARKLKEAGVDDERLPLVMQVKQKYGTLRFYVDYSTGEIEALIERAEVETEITCECCGKPGWINEEKVYLRVLCDDCRALPPRKNR